MKNYSPFGAFIPHMNPFATGVWSFLATTLKNYVNSKADWVTLVYGWAIRIYWRKASVLWRAVDQDGDPIDVMVQGRRNKRAALRFFRKLFKRQGSLPWKVMTDKLRSYSSALREMAPSLIHITKQYANNRAEVSHEWTRQQERQMRRFKSPGQAQRFLWFHGLVNNLYRQQRHLLSAMHYRILRYQAFTFGEKVTGDIRVDVWNLNFRIVLPDKVNLTILLDSIT